MQATEPGSPYLRFATRTLYQACRDAARDQGGRACATCPVHDLCEAGRLRQGGEAMQPDALVANRPLPPPLSLQYQARPPRPILAAAMPG